MARNATKTQMPDAAGAMPAGTANVTTNATGSGERADQHPRAPRAGARRALGRCARRSRIDDDVPHLGRGHHDAGDEGGHAEGVGQVEHEHEAGQGREPAGADRADRIPGDDAAGQGSLRCGHGGSVPIGRRSGSIDLDCAHARDHALPDAVRDPRRRRRRLGNRHHRRAHALDGRGAPRPAPLERRRRARRRRPRPARAARVGARRVRRAPARAAARPRPAARAPRAPARPRAARERQDPRAGLRGGLPGGIRRPATTRCRRSACCAAGAGAPGVPLVVDAPGCATAPRASSASSRRGTTR